MELTKLRKLTKEHLNKSDVDLVDMLICWCDKQDETIKQEILEGCGLSSSEFKDALRVFTQNKGEIKQIVLLNAIQDKENGVFCVNDMIAFLLKKNSSDLVCFLKSRGMDTDAVVSNIEKQVKISACKKATSNKKEYFEHQSGVNMTKLAQAGEYDHLFGRQKDVMRIQEVLLRKDKANVILTGFAGVGKTALVSLLAKKSLKSNGRLAALELFKINLDDIMSGTMFRGELERKLNDLLTSAVRAKNIVFFIDEIHRIMSSQDGRYQNMQIADILKPYIVSDQLRIIGATTTEEYMQSIAKNNALSRRFTHIRIAEPQGEELFGMCRVYSDSLALHHEVTIDDNAVRYAVKLADSYIKDRVQPDKTGEVLDTACVDCIKDGRSTLSNMDIIKTVSSLTDIPVSIITKKAIAWEEIAGKLSKNIFGQQKAIEEVSKTLMVKMAGIKKKDAPIAVFMFAGDSGVGKTQLSKVIAKEVLGNEKRIKVIDMAEFSESHSVSKLTGSPPGYIGSDKEGILPHCLSQDPHQVIVFDEIEKAASEVYRLLLGIMDTGVITSGIGKVYDASNTILIMTTNSVTTKGIQKSTIGFQKKVNTKSTVIDELKKAFPPEFIGRIDNIIMFEPLSNQAIEMIIKTHLEDSIKDLYSNDIKIEYDIKPVVKYVMQHVESRELGAREVKRIIDNHIMQLIVKSVLSEQYDVNLNVLLGQ